MARTFDVVIAGAGPAGASCARRSAELGLSTLLLERAGLPRAKRCAAGLSARALGRLGPAASAIVHREFTTVEIEFGPRTRLVWTGDATVIATTTRPELDAFLVEAAAAAGARVEQGVAVRAVRVEGTSVRVAAGAEELRARYLVAADGARGSLRRLCGAGALRLSSGCYVRAFPPPGAAGPLERGRVTFDLATRRRGYGWVFPKRDHLNIGVYTQRPLRGSIVPDLRAFVAERGLSRWTLEGPFAFPVPAGPGRAAPTVPRVLFAGDAAGLADPVTGEGICHAIASGRAAAECVAEALGSGADAETLYARRVAAEIRPEVVPLRAIGNAFYTMGPAAADRVLAAAWVRAALLRFGPWVGLGSGAGRLSVEKTARRRDQ